MELKPFIHKVRHTPHVMGGRDVINGLDCWGLIIACLDEVYGIKMYDIYAHIDDEHRANKAFAEAKAANQGWKIAPLLNLNEADILICSLHEDRNVSHCALVVEDGYFLHSSGNHGVMHQNPKAFQRVFKIRNAYRYGDH